MLGRPFCCLPDAGGYGANCDGLEENAAFLQKICRHPCDLRVTEPGRPLAGPTLACRDEGARIVIISGPSRRFVLVEKVAKGGARRWQVRWRASGSSTARRWCWGH